MSYNRFRLKAKSIYKKYSKHPYGRPWKMVGRDRHVRRMVYVPPYQGDMVAYDIKSLGFSLKPVSVIINQEWINNLKLE
jgi:hypothetical protein